LPAPVGPHGCDPVLRRAAVGLHDQRREPDHLSVRDRKRRHVERGPRTAQVVELPLVQALGLLRLVAAHLWVRGSRDLVHAGDEIGSVGEHDDVEALML
jgi:hypothetical protein